MDKEELDYIIDNIMTRLKDDISNTTYDESLIILNGVINKCKDEIQFLKDS